MHTLANLAAFGAGGALCAALLLYSERRRRGAGLLLCEECEEFEREPQPAATPGAGPADSSSRFSADAADGARRVHATLPAGREAATSYQRHAYRRPLA